MSSNEQSAMVLMCELLGEGKAHNFIRCCRKLADQLSVKDTGHPDPSSRFFSWEPLKIATPDGDFCWVKLNTEAPIHWSNSANYTDEIVMGTLFSVAINLIAMSSLSRSYDEDAELLKTQSGVWPGAAEERERLSQVFADWHRKATNYFYSVLLPHEREQLTRMID